jgi:hypothetical protein
MGIEQRQKVKMKRFAMILFSAGVLSLALTACAPGRVAVQTPFDASQYAAYTATGRNVIKGQAFLTQNGGGVVTCAGKPVFLTPDSRYFREIAFIATHNRTPEFPHGKGGPEEVVRHTTCDAQGNFEFVKLPDGQYLVMTEVRWMVGYNAQGGALWMPGKVTDGEEKRVVISNDAFVANRNSN